MNKFVTFLLSLSTYVVLLSGIWLSNTYPQFINIVLYVLWLIIIFTIIISVLLLITVVYYDKGNHKDYFVKIRKSLTINITRKSFFNILSLSLILSLLYFDFVYTAVFYTISWFVTAISQTFTKSYIDNALSSY